MATPIYPPTTTTSLLVNTRTTPKIVYLPAASTIQSGKLLFIKDICGNAANSSIYISTTGLDQFDGRASRSTNYGLMSTNFGSLLLAPDGTLNWMILQFYNSNSLTRAVSGFQGITVTFNYTGSAQTFTAPSGSLLVYMWGAGGGGFASTDGGAWNGGAGAYVTGTLTTTPGETLTMIVGLGGSPNAGAATLVQGGGGGAGNPTNNCSSGGGRSAIQRASNDIVVAGGGSGSGWRQGAAATWFGSSNPGTSVNGANGGGGGTQTAGGAAGPVSGYSASTAGSKGQGGNGGGYASGGGGGWYGGGGGGVSAGNGGTGGAGSSYIDLLLGATGESGSVPGAPATTSPYYANFAGRGGQSGASTGGNGLIVIRY
jgi:hypothetical protein